jgi:hypothetical protein
MHIDSAISAIKSGDNDEGRKQLLEAEKSLEGVTSAVDAEKRIEAVLAGCERLSVQQLAEVVNKIPNYNTIAALTTSIPLLTPPGYDDDDDSDPGDEREYVRDEDEEEDD